MIKIVAIDETILDAVIEAVEDFRGKVESGEYVVDYPSSTLHEMDEALVALRNAEVAP